MDLAEHVYEISKKFPGNELYGLVSQIRRAAVSIPSNIAEGHGRKSDGDFVRFLAIANGSLREVETQLLLAVRLGYLNENEITFGVKMCSEVGMLIHGLKKTILNRIKEEKTQDRRM
ncbi:MAG: four helix bundle protein [Planctomycetaceae bacterium]|nr:four helix bundle protein [Planctomycetaceae bacterium]